MNQKTQKPNTPSIQNRKAFHNYHILEKLETGIVLTGTEVKSIRQGHVQMADCYVDISAQLELFLNHCHIEEYEFGNRFNHNPRRRRKLLAHRTEIIKLKKAKEMKGCTLIPIRMYFSKGKVKVEVATCKGKDKQDKRHDLIQKTQTREMERAIKASVR
jgi:SsrA-binding protein